MDSLLSLTADIREIIETRRESLDRETIDYQQLTKDLPGFVFVSDAAGRLLAVNPAMQALGVELGRDWRDYVAADDRARVCDLSAAAFAAGEPVRFDALWNSARGEATALSCRLAPARPKGAGCWIGNCRETAEAASSASPAALSALVKAQSAIAAAGGDAGAVFVIAVKAALSVIDGADGAAIALLEGDNLTYKVTSGESATVAGFSFSRGAGLSGLSLTERRILISHDCLTDPRVDRGFALRTSVRSLIVAPLLRNGQPFGVLQICSAFPHAFCDHAVTLAQLLVGALDLGIAGAAEREAVRARRVSDAALNVSEAQFRTAADALPGLLFVTSPKGENIYVNKGFCCFTGRREADLLGDRWVETLHPDDRPRCRALWEAAVGAGELYEAEYRFRRHDGEWRWHVARALPVRYADGSIEIWVGCCVDIHERRRSEEELQRRIEEALAERRLWAEIVDASETCIQVVSPDLRVLATNPANAAVWERVHGVRPQAGDRLEDNFRARPHLFATAEALWRRALSGESFSHVMTCDRWFELKYSPIYGADGRLIGALRFGDDVTERLLEQRALSERTEDLNRAHAQLQAEMKRREEAQAALVQSQKLEALGRLTSGIAHDFNNVTQAVAGGFAIIEKRAKDAGLVEIARHGAAAAQRGGQLVKHCSPSPASRS